MQETVGKIHWRMDRLPTPVFLGFPGGSGGKESAHYAGDLGLSPGEGIGYPLQSSGLESSMDCIVHGVAGSQTRLSGLHFTYHPLPDHDGFPGGSVVNDPPANAGNPRWIPGAGRSPGEGNGSPLQYSCLENPKDRGVWRAPVHGASDNWTRLSD